MVTLWCFVADVLLFSAEYQLTESDCLFSRWAGIHSLQTCSLVPVEEASTNKKYLKNSAKRDIPTVGVVIIGVYA